MRSNSSLSFDYSFQPQFDKQDGLPWLTWSADSFDGEPPEGPFPIEDPVLWCRRCEAFIEGHADLEVQKPDATGMQPRSEQAASAD
jgi:hypothetical protein